MERILSAQREKIHSLRTNIVQTLEKEREYGCKVGSLKEHARKLTEAFDELMRRVSSRPAGGKDLGCSIVPFIEDAYLDWRDIDGCFKETLKLAYQGSIPQSNLILDQLHSHLRRSIGEHIKAAYADVQSKWKKHLGAYPWDAFLSGSGLHLDADEFEASLKALNHGDEFDVEEASENLTGPLRHILSIYVREKSSSKKDMDNLFMNLWQRPEIVVANDYWRGNSPHGIIDAMLKETDSSSVSGFAKVREFFELSHKDPEPRRKIASILGGISPSEKSKYLGCLALHPAQDIRRYAVTNINIGGFWKSITPKAIPCATILSLLERVVGSKRFDVNFQKIFFNSVYMRLFSLTSRSDVLYARGILRIFTMLNFFLEDAYFEKLMRLVDYVEAKEKFYRIEGSLIQEHLQKLKDAKQKTGSLDTPQPDFGEIPPVVLRKLAREGHFWFDLSMHPIYKIAKETIPFINTQDRALRVVSSKSVNQDVLRAIGRKRQLFSTRRARIALLSNPRTPPATSMEYVPDLDKTDIETLLRKSTLHPELRRYLQSLVRR